METPKFQDSPGNLGCEKNYLPCISPMMSRIDNLPQRTQLGVEPLRTILPKLQPFPCPVCGQTLSCLNELNEHDKKHKSDDKEHTSDDKEHTSDDKNDRQPCMWKLLTFPCSVCGQLFVSPNERDEHDRKHTVDAVVKDYDNRKNDDNHKNVHNHKNDDKQKNDDIHKNVLCVACCETFKSEDMDEHNELHGRHYIECDFCETICYDEAVLRKHLAVHEEEKHNVNTPKDTDKQGESLDCGQIFSSKKKLKTLDKKCKNDGVFCEVCCETIKREDFDKHNEMHVGRHYIECDFCETICFDELVLQRHLAIHEKEKLNVSRNTREEREKQIESRLKDKQQTERKQFQCADCRRKYSTQLSLQNHKKVCNRNKYKCSKCKKCFVFKKILENHICRL